MSPKKKSKKRGPHTTTQRLVFDAQTARELLTGEHHEDTAAPVGDVSPDPLQRDDRDPYGKLQRIAAHIVAKIPYGDTDQQIRDFIREDTDFPQIYESLLQRGLDASAHSLELRPQIEKALEKIHAEQSRKNS